MGQSVLKFGGCSLWSRRETSEWLVDYRIGQLFQALTTGELSKNQFGPQPHSRRRMEDNALENVIPASQGQATVPDRFAGSSQESMATAVYKPNRHGTTARPASKCASYCQTIAEPVLASAGAVSANRTASDSSVQYSPTS